MACEHIDIDIGSIPPKHENQRVVIPVSDI